MRRAWTMAILVAGLAIPARATVLPQIDLAAPQSGARTLARAGTGTAATVGADAVWWNPAGLAGAPGAELLLAHVSLRSGLAHESGVLVLRPLGGRSLVLGLQGDIVREQGIAVPEVAPGLVATPSRAGYRAALHVAGELGSGFALGAALGRKRGLPWSSDPELRTVADAGLHWQRAGTRAGLAMRGAILGRSVDASPVLSAGIAQAFADERLHGSLQLDRDAGGEMQPAGGLEMRALPGLVLRGGARYAASLRRTSGTGGLSVVHDRIRLDYAVCAERGASAVHALTLGFDLGPSPAPPGALPAAGASQPPKPAVREEPPRAAERTPENTAPPPPPTASPRPVENTAPPAPRAAERFTVRAGPYPSIEKAAAAIVLLRRADLRSTVQASGEDYYLIVGRGLTRAEAEKIQKETRRAGVRTTVHPE